MRRLLIVLALMLAPALARAASLDVVEPGPGAALRGGSFATIAWSAAALPAGAEEWEAFLSLDGGGYYAFRITPHLDIARHQFTWLVPNVDTRRARILIRTGNERRETLFELAATFAIARDARAALPRHSIAPAAHGEAAREGDPGVVVWTDGVVQHWTTTRRPALAATHAAARAASTDCAAPSPLAAFRGLPTARLASTRDRARPASQQLPPPNLLLICSRLNI